MTDYKSQDVRLYRPHLAQRINRTPRTITNLWRDGKLPAPHRDEHGRPYLWLSEMIQHEARQDTEQSVA